MVEWAPFRDQESWRSPLASGVLVDEHGRTWRRRGNRSLDVRAVSRLVRRIDVRMVIGESAGWRMRSVEPADRAATWRALRPRYAGTGGKVTGPPWPAEPEYDAGEFRDDAGATLLYLDERC